MTSGTSYSPPPAFGRFKLLHQIGAGVLGPVFRTHDPEHDRLVAVKAFTIDLTPEQATELAAELTRLAALGIDAPYVAAPLAAGIEEFVPYVAVPHVSGESLDAAIRQYGPAPAGDAMRLITHVAEALDAASLAGVHHGSLHPRDIIVTPGETHVTGIGVAQALGRVGLHGPIRRPYVAPEREGGDEWGAPADIYALAAIAYEVLTGRRALPGTDQPLPGLADLHVHDAAALREIIEAAFDPDPGRRPARARDFAAAFAAALSEGSAGAAAGDRSAERRPRKPRTRPQKLPGLDEPLAAAEAPTAPKAKTPGPSVAAPLPVAAPEPAAEASSDIRYVPVTDPADAGETGVEPAGVPAPMPVASRESERGGAGGAARAVDHPAERLTSGATPDLRLVDELLARADAGGESIDTDLAAALDRVTLHLSSGPTPAVTGLDMLGPGPAGTQAIEEIASAGIDLDLATGASPSDRLPEFPEPTPGPTGVVEEPLVAAVAAPMPGRQAPADASSLTLGGAAGAPPPGRPLDLAAVDASLAPPEPPEATAGAEPAPPAAQGAAAGPAAPGGDAEPARPFVRGRGSERRRSQSRYSRIDLTPPPSDEFSETEAGVPRAFDTARSTPPQRPAPDFELLTRPSPARVAVVPVVAGVVAGLILGLAGGYWLGSRSAPAGAPAPAAAVTRVPAPSQAPAGGAASAGPEASGPVTAERTPSGSLSPGASVPAATAARPEPASPVPTATERPARPEAAATRGAIQVTASQQANVYLDGERRGLTPRTLKNLPLGSHVVRITKPGYAAQEQTVVLTAEEPSANLSFTLRRGTSSQPPAAGRQAPAPRSVLTVFIDSNPQGARIRIDGRDLAPTPLMVRQLRPGTHTLELRMPGYKTWTQKLTVAAGDDRRITATLERDTTR